MVLTSSNLLCFRRPAVFSTENQHRLQIEQAPPFHLSLLTSSMAMPTEQQNQRKHYCRICKKGFSCGRALGGHMRAHCINDDNIPGHHYLSDEWDISGGKRIHDLRTITNQRICGNCGKKFYSWKSFLDHGRCINSDDESPPPATTSTALYKDKRSRRKGPKLTEEEKLATWLVMLSAGQVDPHLYTDDESDESSATIAANPFPRGIFECKACKKVFSSPQALGGHRASHKKVKGCFATPVEAGYPHNHHYITGFSDSRRASKKKSKIHECSICHRQFNSGQALGGHKRCHWITNNATIAGQDEQTFMTADEIPANELIKFRPLFENSDALNLNIPTSTEELIGVPLQLELPSSINFQPDWNSDERNKIMSDMIIEEDNEKERNLEDDGESNVKLAKLSDLMETTVDGESSPWLQVGIGSKSN